MNKKIVYVSDFNFRGSGYLNISIPICENLSRVGYDIKAIGLGYSGDEHSLGFSILPCSGFSDAHAMLNNLKFQWEPDLVIVALDIPHIERVLPLVKSLGLKFMVVTPLENAPLTFSWAKVLQEVDKVFFISQLGTEEAIKAEVNAEHLVIGMDTNSWRLRTPEEYKKARATLNISDDTIVVITVADNQERKNLSKAMEIISKLKHEKRKKVKYLLVTRENSDVGWKLRDLAMYYKIPSDVSIFERGLPFKELYTLYAMSDVFLLTSKAEGLCMPVMEAMSAGIPVVATACGSLPELLGTDRGFLMETKYVMIDPWGNELRHFPSAESGVDGIIDMVSNTEVPKKAREYMETRTWDYPIQQLVNAMEILFNEEK